MILSGIRVCCDAGSESRLDALDARCRVVCAFFTAFLLASLRDTASLLAASLLPAMLLCVDGLRGAEDLARRLLPLNGVSVLVVLFLPLTYPGERVFYLFSERGLFMSFIIIWKLNLISAVLLKLVASMGMTRLSGALEGLGVPLKLRSLLLLTTRCVFLLGERFSTICRALDLRAGDASGFPVCRAFAYMVGTTLIHSSDRAERSVLAIGCRGGLSGFAGLASSRWTWREPAFCLLFVINSAFILMASL
ncbi:MAG: energy-coupling factor transporter transmembrane protein EcfT [Synergistaceae bacterium]|jgi:cobalt/nickel transport system permease protein|nr:energy-coupling factor transporter transmembrane protein EcfT [Synergistaceae bacterium]